MREDKGGIVKVIEINKFREKEIGCGDGVYEHLSVDLLQGLGGNTLFQEP